MSLYHSSQPAAINRFRAKTEGHAKVAGVTLPSFRCKKCRLDKPVKGRKLLVPGSTRFGYVCADCQ